MDWFRVDSDVPRHPAVSALARQLSISRVETLGHLLSLWAVVAEHAESGDLGVVATSDIEEWAAWDKGRPNEFVSAMKETGWLTEKRELSGWKKRHEYLLSERKRKAALRKVQRDRARAVQGAPDPRRAGPKAHPARGAQPTVPYRTDVLSVERTKDVIVGEGAKNAEKSTSDHSTSPDLPVELLQRWNDLARVEGFSVAEKLTPKRRIAANQRIAEGLLDRWDAFAAALKVSKWHHGENDRKWRASFDWLLERDKWLGMIERAVPVPIVALIEDPAIALARKYEREQREKIEIAEEWLSLVEQGKTVPKWVSQYVEALRPQIAEFRARLVADPAAAAELAERRATDPRTRLQGVSRRPPPNVSG